MTSGRIVLVTGGNRGLGLEVVKQLSQQSDIATVLMGSRDDAGGTETIKQHNLPTDKVLSVSVDVTSKETLKSAAELIKDKYKKLDLLICNAGIASFDNNKDIAVSTLAVNYYGVLDTIESFSTLLQSGSKIIIVSSEVGTWAHNAFQGELRKKLDDYAHLQLSDVTQIAETYIRSFDDESLQSQFPSGQQTFGSYGMSKALISTAGRVLAREYKNNNIAVLLACPGYCATDLNKNSGPRTAHKGGQSIISADNYGLENAGDLIQDDYVCPIASEREALDGYRSFRDRAEGKPVQPVKAH